MSVPQGGHTGSPALDASLEQVPERHGRGEAGAGMLSGILGWAAPWILARLPSSQPGASGGRRGESGAGSPRPPGPGRQAGRAAACSDYIRRVS